MRHESNSEDPDTQEIMTVDEVAGLVRVNRKTLYAAIKAGEVPGVRQIGRRIRIHRATVLAWIASGNGPVSRSRKTS